MRNIVQSGKGFLKITGVTEQTLKQFARGWQGVPYRFGGKAVLTLTGGGCYFATKPVPGIDCSGFVRAYVAVAGCVLIPVDGSEQIREWVVHTGFKRSNADPDTRDDIVRILFLAPDAPEPGHVAFLVNGCLYESHGGRGVDGTRIAAHQSWVPRCAMYVIGEP